MEEQSRRAKLFTILQDDNPNSNYTINISKEVPKILKSIMLKKRSSRLENCQGAERTHTRCISYVKSQNLLPWLISIFGAKVKSYQHKT